MQSSSWGNLSLFFLHGLLLPEPTTTTLSVFPPQQMIYHAFSRPLTFARPYPCSKCFYHTWQKPSRAHLEKTSLLCKILPSSPELDVSPCTVSQKPHIYSLALHYLLILSPPPDISTWDEDVCLWGLTPNNHLLIWSELRRLIYFKVRQCIGLKAAQRPSTDPKPHLP